MGKAVETRQSASENKVSTGLRAHLEGRVMVPALLYMAGVPFGLVLLLWFFFFRG